MLLTKENIKCFETLNGITQPKPRTKISILERNGLSVPTLKWKKNKKLDEYHIILEKRLNVEFNIGNWTHN